MKGIVKRYAVTPRQRRWALDIVHRLLLLERESTKDRGLLHVAERNQLRELLGD